jgi:hypothetical protein
VRAARRDAASTIFVARRRGRQDRPQKVGGRPRGLILNLSLQTGHRAVLRRRPSGRAAAIQKALRCISSHITPVMKSAQVEYWDAVPIGTQLHQPRIMSCGSEIGSFSEIAERVILLLAKFHNSFNFLQVWHFHAVGTTANSLQRTQRRRRLRLTVLRRLLACACHRSNLRIPPLPEAWKRARPNLAHRTSPRSAMSQGHSPRTRGSALVINICWSKCRPRRMALTKGKTNSRRSADGDFM